MWIADGKRLICLECRDIKLECRDIVFEGKNIEILRHPSPQAASAVFQTIVKRLSEKGEVI